MLFDSYSSSYLIIISIGHKLILSSTEPLNSVIICRIGQSSPRRSSTWLRPSSSSCSSRSTSTRSRSTTRPRSASYVPLALRRPLPLPQDHLRGGVHLHQRGAGDHLLLRALQRRPALQQRGALLPHRHLPQLRDPDLRAGRALRGDQARAGLQHHPHLLLVLPGLHLPDAPGARGLLPDRRRREDLGAGAEQPAAGRRHHALRLQLVHEEARPQGADEHEPAAGQHSQRVGEFENWRRQQELRRGGGHHERRRHLPLPDRGDESAPRREHHDQNVLQFRRGLQGGQEFCRSWPPFTSRP